MRPSEDDAIIGEGHVRAPARGVWVLMLFSLRLENNLVDFPLQ
jgi:hypothetical protein